MHLEHLKSLPQWVNSKIVMRKDKRTKPPYQLNGKRASVTNPDTWTTYEKAKANVSESMPYVGFVLTKDDPYTIVDLDAPNSPAEIERNKKIIDALDSYTEKSLSGKGVHIIVKGSLPAGVHRGNIEMYSADRFMVTTEDVVRNKPIADRQSVLDDMFRQMQAAPVKTGYTDQPEQFDDAQILDAAHSAENAEKFTALYNGLWQQFKYPSQSEADSALITMLGFYSKNEAQVVRLFKASKMYRQLKNKQDKYIIKTLQRAKALEPPPVDFSQLKAFTVAEPEKESVKRKSLSWPPGLLGEIARYIYDNSMRPVKEMAICAALCWAAGVCARSFNVNGTGLNIFVLLLGGTGTGKEGMSTGIDSIFGQLRETIPTIMDHLGPAGFASGPAMLRALDKQPCFISVLGEFGFTMQQICEPRAAKHDKTLLAMLLALFSKSGYGKILQPNVYSDSTKNTQSIDSPCVSLLGESTPDVFYDSIDESHIAMGLIPRFSVIEYKGPRTKSKREDPKPLPQHIIANLELIVMKALQVAQQGSVVKIKGCELLYDFDDYVDDKINNSSNNAIKELWNRAHIKALKIAGIIAVFMDCNDPVITKEAKDWALEFVRHDVEGMVAKYETGEHGLGDSRQEADIRSLITQWHALPKKKQRVYRTPEKVVGNKAIVPRTYLKLRALKMKSFMADKRGATVAFNAVIKELITSNVISVINGQLEFNSAAVLYRMGESW